MPAEKSPNVSSTRRAATLAVRSAPPASDARVTPIARTAPVANFIRHLAVGPIAFAPNSLQQSDRARAEIRRAHLALRSGVEVRIVSVSCDDRYVPDGAGRLGAAASSLPRVGEEGLPQSGRRPTASPSRGLYDRGRDE